MTTLILAQKKIRSWCPEISLAGAENWFSVVNRRGFVTYGLYALGVVFLGLYLTALYVTFDLGFSLRKINPQVTKISEDVLMNELALHNTQTSLTREKESLGRMEEISDLKYIFTPTPESYVYKDSSE